MQPNFFFSFEAMGTVLEISIWDVRSPLMYEKIKREILDYTNYYDETYSRFKKDSLVWKIADTEKWPCKFKVPKEMIDMLQIN